MNKIVNFARKMSIFTKKMELDSEKINKQVYVYTQAQLLETQKELLNDFGIKTDNLTEEEIRQKAENLLKDI